MYNDITTPRFPHHPDNVPAELKAGDVWVTCDEHKAPLIPIENGAVFAAASTNPDTWRSYDTALATWQQNEHIAGIGRVIAADEGYVGVDLDDCLDPETGELAPWADTIISRIDSYSEVSPSLRGVKIWVRARRVERAYKKPGLEIYPRGRYFTITGCLLGGKFVPISERDDELAAIIEEEFPRVDRSYSVYDGSVAGRRLDLDTFLDRAGTEIFEEVYGERSARVAFKIRCPWWEEHSEGDVTGTRTGQYESGALFFICEHAHCYGRSWQQFRALLNPRVYLGRPSRSKACRGGGRLR